MRLPWLSPGCSDSKLTLAQALLFSRLLSLLKDDILLVQPLRVSTDEAPTILPPSVSEFMADAVGIALDSVASCWKKMKKDIWKLPIPTLSEEEEELFRKYGWRRGITSFSLYPPSHYCENPACCRLKPLKKATTRQVIVYTLAKGVIPTYEIQLYCPDCNTTYFPDFSVCAGARTYYGGIPPIMQVGAHQFVERKLVGMWISLMLVAWVSATNCSRSYDMSLSEQDLRNFSDGGWQFGCILTTDHVWDAFILLTLLDHNERQGTCLIIPHTGEQKTRFTAAMKARNDEVVKRGQDVVGHCCDKCLRVWREEGGAERHIQPVVCDGLSMGHVRCQVAHCTTELASNRDRFCPDHAGQASQCSIVGCNRPARQDHKSCDLEAHTAMERAHYERGRAAFTLRERLQRHRQTHPENALDGDEEELDDEEDLRDDIEWFETDAAGNVRVYSADNPGSVGVVDSDLCEASKAPAAFRESSIFSAGCT
ncbi:hypothetical protein GGX14DRAFT_391184 [Mycena pura]|uniref:CxC5 like cysteine cluster associated with KDZ domain-containing protein n=1 Tax=Mycena pura TaxID=153505 RepID=A0AAD6YE41_9AGAR|nr:hypothetical protein GGX14DRAFT_391184 [Mycena pura]